RPARTEGGVGDGDEAVAAEQRAGVVLAHDVAVDDVDVLAAVDVEAVVVEVDAIVDAHAVEAHVAAFENAHAVVGAAGAEDVADGQIPTAVEDRQMRAVDVPFGAIPARAGVVALAGVKEVALAIDGALPLDRDVLGIGGIEEHDIAVSWRHALS